MGLIYKKKKVMMKHSSIDLVSVIEAHPETMLVIHAADLGAFGRSIAAEVRRDLERQRNELAASNAETYITSDRVETMLSVSRSTLYRLTKANIIDSVTIGGKRRYKLSSIKNYIENGN